MKSSQVRFVGEASEVPTPCDSARLQVLPPLRDRGPHTSGRPPRPLPWGRPRTRPAPRGGAGSGRTRADGRVPGPDLDRAPQAEQDREPVVLADGRRPGEPEPLQGEVRAAGEPLARARRDRLGTVRPGSTGPAEKSVDSSASARWSCRGLPSAPTRPQSWSRKVASDICWISASTTPAPMAWTVPAGIRMQSPGRGSNRCSSGSTSPVRSASAKVAAGDVRAEPGVDHAPGLGVDDDPGLGLAIVVGQPPPAFVVGVDLDREDLVRVDQFDQQRELVAGPSAGPNSSSPRWRTRSRSELPASGPSATRLTSSR